MRISRAFGGILVLAVFLVLTAAHVAGAVHFGVSERVLLLGVAYGLLGIDGLVAAFVTAIERINLSIERDTDGDEE